MSRRITTATEIVLSAARECCRQYTDVQLMPELALWEEEQVMIALVQNAAIQEIMTQYCFYHNIMTPDRHYINGRALSIFILVLRERRKQRAERLSKLPTRDLAEVINHLALLIPESFILVRNGLEVFKENFMRYPHNKDFHGEWLDCAEFLNVNLADAKGEAWFQVARRVFKQGGKLYA